MDLTYKILLLLNICAITCISCNCEKNIVSEKYMQINAESPCSENGKSDSKYFRANASAMSSSISLSREKAIAEAKTLIAKQIIDKAKIAANRYAEDSQIADKQTFLKDIEHAANKTADILLSEISPTCEKYSETNGKYTTYISTEISRQAILNELIKQIANHTADIEKFIIIFNNYE